MEHSISLYAAQQQAAMAAQQAANQLANATRRLEPGITWERTQGNRHRVVIRREAEYVADYNVMAGSLLNSRNLGMGFGSSGIGIGDPGIWGMI